MGGCPYFMQDLEGGVMQWKVRMNGIGSLAPRHDFISECDEQMRSVLAVPLNHILSPGGT